jgi:hypothetical protein
MEWERSLLLVEHICICLFSRPVFLCEHKCAEGGGKGREMILCLWIDILWSMGIDWATPCLSWLQLYTSWHYLPYNDYEFRLWKRIIVAAEDRVKKSNAAAAEKRWHVCIKPLLLPCLLCIFFLKLTFEVRVFSAASPHLCCILVNGANVCCLLSSLPLLSPATTAEFGSYLSCQYKSR